MNNMIVYEQPLNEIIRVCLRLEHLFQQIDHHLKDMTTLGTREVISSIIDILQVLDRPDLKSKLAKELNQQHVTLSRYGTMPETDTGKIGQLTTKIEGFSHSLIDSSGKIGQRLRDMDLFNTLRLHLATPGGGCSFDLPVFHYWLQQTENDKQQAIRDWLSEFEQIKTSIQLVLDLVRNSAKTEQKVATHGFHQELLDPQSNLKMIRIAIEKEVAAFPEISIGRHFLSIRYFAPDIEKRPVQYPGNLNFYISYCNS